MDHLVEVEDQVQLTHIAKVVVKYLHKQVDTLQVGKLVVCDVHTHGKEQTRIPPVYHFVGLELQTISKTSAAVTQAHMAFRPSRPFLPLQSL